MAAVLAIAGCGPRLEVALQVPGGAAPALVALTGPTPRSDLILAAIHLLLEAAGMGPGDLAAVVATRGPGSFTGIRVALATAQGLSLANGIPAHGFSSLLAQAARSDVERCLAAQPARRGFVYVQQFERRQGTPVAAHAPAMVPIAELLAHELPIVAPSGLQLPGGTVTAACPRTTSEALLALHDTPGTPDPSTLVPLYLEPPPAAPPSRNVRAWQPSPMGS